MADGNPDLAENPVSAQISLSCGLAAIKALPGENKGRAQGWWGMGPEFRLLGILNHFLQHAENSQELSQHLNNMHIFPLDCVPQYFFSPTGTR